MFCHQIGLIHVHVVVSLKLKYLKTTTVVTTLLSHLLVHNRTYSKTWQHIDNQHVILITSKKLESSRPFDGVPGDGSQAGVPREYKATIPIALTASLHKRPYVGGQVAGRRAIRVKADNFVFRVASLFTEVPFLKA